MRERRRKHTEGKSDHYVKEDFGKKIRKELRKWNGKKSREE